MENQTKGKSLNPRQTGRGVDLVCDVGKLRGVAVGEQLLGVLERVISTMAHGQRNREPTHPEARHHGRAA